MEKLIVLSEDGVSEEFQLTEQQTSIGRDEHNGICLGDKSVSRHHATVSRVFRGFTIQDEGSTNGTRVNGRVIAKQFLKHRDLIEIGKYHMRFLAEAPQGLQTDDADKTTVLRPTHQSRLTPPPETRRPVVTPTPVAASQPQAKAVPEPTETTAPMAANDGMGAKIRYLAGEQQGKELMIDRAFFSVGNPGGDLVLINKRHTGYFLLKVGGDVPPSINGTPIRAGGVELSDGDRIELGALSLEFLA